MPLPYEELEVGDSFFIPETRLKKASVYQNCRFGKIMNRKFRVRKATEDGQPGVRVWRVE